MLRAAYTLEGLCAASSLPFVPQLAPGFSVGPALYLAHCPASLVA